MEVGDTVVPLFATVDDYVKKGVGIDMMLKSILGLARVVSIHSTDKDISRNYADLASSIINCRMLSNHFRHIASFKYGVMTLQKREGPVLPWLCLMGSFFFRSLEQLYGDLNYYQMTFMHHWSRDRLSFGYWFFKSLSLTCGCLYELFRLKDHIASPQWKTQTQQERSKVINNSFISIVRYLCDMVVYYKWISWYNPYKTIQYLCGSISGMLGVYLVWRDTKAARVAAMRKVTTMNGSTNNNNNIIISKDNNNNVTMNGKENGKVNGVMNGKVNGVMNGKENGKLNGKENDLKGETVSDSSEASVNEKSLSEAAVPAT